MKLRSPFTRLDDAVVFAADSTSAQLVFAAPESTVSTSTVPDSTVEVFVDGKAFGAQSAHGVAVVAIEGLCPDSAYEAVLDGSSRTLQFHTKPDLGPLLSRFATVSDIHIGLESFGIIRQLFDAEPGQNLRCAKAAVAEAHLWGASSVLVKGDVTEDGAQSQWAVASEIFTQLPDTTAILATPGNHDVKQDSYSPPLAVRELTGGYDAVQQLKTPGATLVLVDTTIPGSGYGQLRSELIEQIIEIGRATPEPLFVGLHHNLQRTAIPWFWPPGITPRHWKPLVDNLDKRDAPTLLSSGHTHRNRAHSLGKSGLVTFTEVSSTSDFPGVWAGYEVTSRGIRQTTRRISHPDALRWFEQTKRVGGGIWPRWSPGTLADRCVDALC